MTRNFMADLTLTKFGRGSCGIEPCRKVSTFAKRSRQLWRLCGVGLLLLTACGAAPATRSAMIEDFVLSPDGRLVAFQFVAPRGARGIGLYEWQTGNLIRIPNPSGQQLGVPNFSYDGTRMAVVIQAVTDRVLSDIAVVDLATMAVTRVTHGDRKLFRAKGVPVFQPNTDEILFTENGIGVFTKLRTVNLRDGSEHEILNDEDAFVNVILRPYFVGQNEIFFQAIAPVNPGLQQEIRSIGTSDASAKIAYRLPFGRHPELLSTKLEKTRLRPFSDSISSLSASEGGRIIVGIGSSDKMYDLFRIDNNFDRIKLTSLDAYMAHSHISYDGKVVAFGVDKENGGNIDIAILSFSNNQTRMTGIREKIAESSDFMK